VVISNCLRKGSKNILSQNIRKVKQFLVKIALFLCMLLFLPDFKKYPVSIILYIFFTLRPFKSRTPIVLCNVRNITGSNSQGASPLPPSFLCKER
jgi:hypothetical protein